MIGRPIQYKSVDEATTFTINDRTYETLMIPPYYFICVETVDGLFGADISYEAHPVPGIAGSVVGEVSGDVIRRGKTVTLSGQIYARGQAELYEASFYLMQMFAETDGLRKLLFNPWNLGAAQLYLKCKPSQDLSVVMQTNNTRHMWPWTCGLRCDDPRTYLASNNTVFPTWQQ
jgi:hypothetical protein